MHPAKRTLVLPLLAAALAGCGGGGNDDFVEGYNAATAPLTELMSDLGGASALTADAGGRDAARQLATVADGLEDVEGRLRDLDPPSDAADEFDRMLTALDANTAQVRTMAKAVRSGDLEKLTAATSDFATKGGELVQAEEALRAAVSG